jgi:sugar-specific transcriptional regulator TrmB
MCQEKTLKNLEELGFSKIEAQIYLLLGKKGPQRAKDIVKNLKINRQRLYEILKKLEKKGLINATLEHPTKFGAEPFEKVLDLFVKSKMEEALRIKEEKKTILEDWQLITLDETIDSSPRFMVFEGKNFIYPRLQQMIKETKKEMLLITNPIELTRAEQYGLIKAAFQHSRKKQVNFKYLTEINEHNAKLMNQLIERTKTHGNFEGRTPNLGLHLTSRMIIKDDSEVVFFINKTNEEDSKDKDDICLWTNSSSIVKSFRFVFENLWHNAIDIEKKMAEIQKGETITSAFLIQDAVIAKAKFEKTIASAKKEIIIATSPSGLVTTWANLALIKDATKRGVSIKFLTPITRECLKIATELSSYCQIKHIAAPYLEVAVIDGEHLFQFNNYVNNGCELYKQNSFENTTYSNDPITVQKTKNMLAEIWRNTISPGSINMGGLSKSSLIVRPPVNDDEYTVSKKDSPYQKMSMSVEEKIEEITEEYVLNKILNPKKDENIIQRYGSSANVVILPPKQLKLPNMIFSFNHCSKQSTFGNEDYMVIYQWLEDQNKKAFVPVAIIGDNAESLKRLKEISFVTTPAADNTIIVNKDQLQIQTHGNRLFVGWTIPIPLADPVLILPPASMLFEGYGKIKSVTINFTLPSGVKTMLEGNGLDAFVTFFLPNYKYAGPGTDGIFVRDFIMTTIYPQEMKF